MITPSATASRLCPGLARRRHVGDADRRPCGSAGALLALLALGLVAVEGHRPRSLAPSARSAAGLRLQRALGSPGNNRDLGSRPDGTRPMAAPPSLTTSCALRFAGLAGADDDQPANLEAVRRHDGRAPSRLLPVKWSAAAARRTRSAAKPAACASQVRTSALYCKTRPEHPSRRAKGAKPSLRASDMGSFSFLATPTPEFRDMARRRGPAAKPCTSALAAITGGSRFHRPLTDSSGERCRSATGRVNLAAALTFSIAFSTALPRQGHFVNRSMAGFLRGNRPDPMGRRVACFDARPGGEHWGRRRRWGRSASTFSAQRSVRSCWCLSV